MEIPRGLVHNMFAGAFGGPVNQVESMRLRTITSSAAVIALLSLGAALWGQSSQPKSVPVKASTPTKATVAPKAAAKPR